MITIQQITDMQQKQSFRDLLLDADPSWEMVSGYLNGDMYVLYCDGTSAGTGPWCSGQWPRSSHW